MDAQPQPMGVQPTGDLTVGTAESLPSSIAEASSVDTPIMNMTGNLSATVELRPNTLWFDHGSVVRNIMKSIQTKFDGPYTSWSSMLDAVKDCWWRFFRVYVFYVNGYNMQ
ncbi:hypothetical protein Ancab_039892 [Ancistrocladus abbreviatus]